MNKISTDVQKFIAGALAYIGFQAFVWTANIILFTHTDVLTICLTAFPSLGLPIGAAMFIGNERAISWAQSYLAIYLLFNIGSAVITCFSSSPGLPQELKNVNFWQSVFVLIGPAILLGLLLWCHPKRFRHKPLVT